MVDITVRLGADVEFRNIVKRNYYDRDFFELSNILCGLSNEQLVQKNRKDPHLSAGALSVVVL